jgi:hypothetical protein
MVPPLLLLLLLLAHLLFPFLRCGHCKSIEPTIRSLGKYVFKHSHNPPPTPQSFVSGIPSSKRGLFVGKMDGTKNDFAYHGVVIRGFPTILLFK